MDGSGWGLIFFGYVIYGFFWTDIMDANPRPKNTLPGSAIEQGWKDREALLSRRRIIWSAGLVTLLTVWVI